MEFFVNACVIVTTTFAFGYLCYAMIRPERF
jgi:K+-transporting ATPase KdpF subunit